MRAMPARGHLASSLSKISGRICRKRKRLRSVRAINGGNQQRNSAPIADGDYAACVRILAPAAAVVVRVGGSHAKREVIEDKLLNAIMKSGQTAKTGISLSARRHAGSARRYP